MRAVVQRVRSARVEVEGRIVGEIGKGLLVLLGIGHEDTEETARYLARRIVKFRIFEDRGNPPKMNLDVIEIGGSILVVSQFTLLADTRKGNRPSWSGAAPPEKAEPLYQIFCEEIRARGVPLAQGVFRAVMQVSLINDGPVTLVIDT